MVKVVGDDGVFGVEDGLEEASVGVEAGAVEDGLFGAEEFADAALELGVDGLGSADEADAGEAVSPVLKRLRGGGDDGGVVGEPEIIVGAEVEDVRAVGEVNVRLLGAGDDAFALVEAGGFDFVEPVLEVLLGRGVHWLLPDCLGLFKFIAVWVWVGWGRGFDPPTPSASSGQALRRKVRKNEAPILG